MVACAALVVSFGCHHIGGKCDCGYNPSDYDIHAPVNPYPAVPVVKPKPPGGNE